MPEDDATASAPQPERAPAARGDGGAKPETRIVDDPRSLRALAHPVRIELLEALTEGPLTATQAAELIGESPTTCSFHFRQLAKYGFVEDAGEPGARERPWKLSSLSMSVPSRSGDAETDVVAAATIDLWLERALDRVRKWNRERSLYPDAWDTPSGMSQTLFFLTAEELAELRAELEPIFYRYFERMEDPSLRPEGSLPVELLLFLYPRRPPKEG